MDAEVTRIVRSRWKNQREDVWRAVRQKHECDDQGKDVRDSVQASNAVRLVDMGGKGKEVGKKREYYDGYVELQS